ncbi:MAG: NAD(P)/FAD-dependent oxidoreductase [Epsilonproteobacteria bacterium]|nr:NAD(P)/FAD-dependent oxidoreductase [Campylobacterota bacterium]
MYDVIVIGGGLGYVSAILLAKSGKKVALIEKNLIHIGGTCLNNGCIPSKNLLHRAKTLLESKEEFFKGKIDLNLKKLQEKIEANLDKNHNAILNQLQRAGVEIIEAEGFVVDEGVEIEGKILKAKHIIIATGAKPRIPENIPYDGKKIITSNEALNLKSAPKSISVYGSGAIGLEMASFFAAIGSEVNLIYRHEHISRKIDPEIVNAIEEQLKAIGINLIPNTTVEKAEVNKEVVINDNIKSEYLLVATGRIPNTECVKTDKIKVDKGIVVDEYFQTTMDGVYAIGDCNGLVELAHAARAEAINVANQILGKKEVLNLDLIPRFIYTIPLSYASVGVKEKKAGEYKIANLGIGGSYCLDTLGIAKIYADEENFLSGAEVFAPNAEELIGTIAAALTAEMDIELFKEVIFPHPTYSEVFDRAVRKIR